MATKHGKCPFCMPEGGAILTKTYGQPEHVVPAYGGATFHDHVAIDVNSNVVPTWECNNCGMHIARRVPKRSTQLTPSQKRSIERIRTFWERKREHTDPTGFNVTSVCECDTLDVTQFATGTAFVVVQWTTTINNRHGSFTSIRRGTFSIGRRGAISSGKRRGTQALIYETY